jgi:hypothetical protein
MQRSTLCLADLSSKPTPIASARMPWTFTTATLQLLRLPSKRPASLTSSKLAVCACVDADLCPQLRLLLCVVRSKAAMPCRPSERNQTACQTATRTRRPYSSLLKSYPLSTAPACTTSWKASVASQARTDAECSPSSGKLAYDPSASCFRLAVKVSPNHCIPSRTDMTRLWVSTRLLAFPILACLSYHYGPIISPCVFCGAVSVGTNEMQCDGRRSSYSTILQRVQLLLYDICLAPGGLTVARCSRGRALEVLQAHWCGMGRVSTWLDVRPLPMYEAHPLKCKLLASAM